MSRKKRKLKVENFGKGQRRVSVREQRSDPSSASDQGPVVAVQETPWEINPEMCKQRCYQAYMLHYADKAELLEMGIPEATVNGWLYQPTSDGRPGWHLQRELFYKQEMQAFMKGRSQELKKTGARILNIANRTLLELDDSGETVSVAQLEKLFNSFGKVMHWVQIEDGKPTSISKSFDYSQDSIRELISELQELDPLIDYDPKGKHNG